MGRTAQIGSTPYTSRDGVSGDEDSNHMTAARTRANTVVIELQPRSFYTDIINVCARAQGRRWNGRVRVRYNGWMLMDLDAAQTNSTVSAAKGEIAAL